MEKNCNIRNCKELKSLTLSSIENIYDSDVFCTIFDIVSTFSQACVSQSKNLPTISTILKSFMNSVDKDGKLHFSGKLFDNLLQLIQLNEYQESLFYQSSNALNFVIQNNLPIIDRNAELINNFSFVPSNSQLFQEQDDSLGSIMFNNLFSSIENIDILGIDFVNIILPKILQAIPETRKLKASQQACENTQNLLLKIGLSTQFQYETTRPILFSILLKLSHSLETVQFIYSIIYLSIKSNLPFDYSITNELFSNYSYHIPIYRFSLLNLPPIQKLFLVNETIYALLDNLSIVEVKSDKFTTITRIPDSFFFKFLSLTHNHLYFLDFCNSNTLKVTYLPMIQNEQSNDRNIYYQLNENIHELLCVWSDINVYCLFSTKNNENSSVLIEISLNGEKLNFKQYPEFETPELADYGFNISQTKFVIFSRKSNKGYIYQISSENIEFRLTCSSIYPKKKTMFAANSEMVVFYSSNEFQIMRVDCPFLFSIDNQTNELEKSLLFLMNQSLLRNLDDCSDLLNFFTSNPFNNLHLLIKIGKELITKENSQMLEICLMSLFLNVQSLSSSIKSAEHFTTEILSILNELRLFLNQLLFSKICSKSIFKLLLLIISNHYSIIFYPKYQHIVQIFKQLFENQFSSGYFSDDVILILFSTPITLYIANEQLFDLAYHITIPFLADNFIFRLGSMLQIEIKKLLAFNITKFEPLMFGFLRCFLDFIFSHDKKTVFMHLFLFTIRITHLDGCLQLKSKFLELTQPHLSNILNYINGVPDFQKSLKKYDNLPPHKYERRIESSVFETPHPLPHKYEYKSRISFVNSDEIVFRFDPKCSLDPKFSEFFISYMGNDGKVMKISFPTDGIATGFPRSLRIPANDCLLIIRSQQSSEFYGIKFTAYSESFDDKIAFRPSFTHFSFVFFTYMIGNCIKDCLKSFDTSKEEKACLPFAQANLLSSDLNLLNRGHSLMAPIAEQPAVSAPGSPTRTRSKMSSSSGVKFDGNQPPVLPNRIRKMNSPIFRSGSISFENQNTIYNKSLQKDFLTALQSNVQTKGTSIPFSFLKFMYEHFPFHYHFKEDLHIINIEKTIVAALLHHSNTVNEAINIAVNSSSKAGIEIPQKLRLVWKSLYSMRLYLYQLRQKEMKNENFESVFASKLCEIENKARFLLTRNSINSESSIQLVLSFLQSTIKLSKIKRAADMRNKRIEMRTKTLTFFNDLLELHWDLPISSKQCIVLENLSIFSLLLNENDTKSVDSDFIKSYFECFTKLTTFLLSSIIQIECPIQMRSSIIQLLQFRFDKLLNPRETNELLDKLIEFQMNHPGDYLHESIWPIIAILSFNSNCQPNLLGKILFSNSQDFALSLLIQSILVISRKVQYTDFSDYIAIFQNSSPSVICSIANLICQHMIIYGYDPNLGVPDNFLIQLMFIIGSIFSNQPITDFFTGEIPATSRFWIATEFISLIRLCCKSFSIIKQQVIDLIDAILNDSLDTIQNDLNERFLVIATFLILGNDFCTLQTTDHSMILNNTPFPHYFINSNEYAKHQIRGYSLDDSSIQISDSNPIPLARVSIESDFLLINEKQCKLFKDLLEFNNYDILSITFHSALNVLLQNPKNIEMFINCIGFELILKYSVNLTQGHVNTSINTLCSSLIDLLIEKEILKNKENNKNVDPAKCRVDDRIFNELLDFNDEGFTLLYGQGEVDQKRSILYSFSHSSSTAFIFKSALSCDSYFYEISGDSLEYFACGFLSHRDTIKQSTKYVFDKPCGVIISDTNSLPINPLPHYKSIACGYYNHHVYFFIGNKYYKFGPVHFHFYLPFVEFKNTIRSSCTFSLEKTDHYISLLSDPNYHQITITETLITETSVSTISTEPASPSISSASISLTDMSTNNLAPMIISDHHIHHNRESGNNILEQLFISHQRWQNQSTRTLHRLLRSRTTDNSAMALSIFPEEEEAEEALDLRYRSNENNTIDSDDHDSYSYMSDSSNPTTTLSITDDIGSVGNNIGGTNNTPVSETSGILSSRKISTSRLDGPLVEDVFIGQRMRVNKSQGAIYADKMKDEYWTPLHNKYDQKVGVVVGIEEQDNDMKMIANNSESIKAISSDYNASDNYSIDDQYEPEPANRISLVVLLRFFDQELASYVYIRFDARFLIPVTTNPFESRIARKYSIDNLYESLSIRIARYTSMIIINKLLQEKSFKIFPEFVFLFSSYIREVLPFEITTKPTVDCNNIIHINKNYKINEASHTIIQNRGSYYNLLCLILKQAMNIKEFVSLMFNHILTSFPHFTFDDLMSNTPNDLIFESAHPQTQLSINRVIEYHKVSGFILLVSPETDSGDSIFTISGNNLNFSFKKYDKSLNYSGIIKDNKVIVNHKSTPTNNYGLKIAFYPLRTYHCDSISNTASSSLHVFFTLIRLALTYTKDKTFLISFFSKVFIPMIFDSLLSNDIVIGSSYYDLIVNLFCSLRFTKYDISLDLVDKFDKFWNIFKPSFDPSEPISICVQQILMVKIMLKKAAMTLNVKDIRCDLPPVDSIMINHRNINGSKVKRSITRIFDSYTNASKKDDDFGDVLSTLELCFSLADNNQFLQHILIKDWLEQFATNLMFESDHPYSQQETSILIETEYNKEVKIKFDEMTDLPIGTEIYAADVSNQKILKKIRIDAQTKIAKSSFIVKIKLPQDIKDKLWGFKFYVTTTMFSDFGKQELFVLKRLDFFKCVSLFELNWNYEIDEILLRLKLNDNKEFAKFELPSTAFASYPLLSKIDRNILYLRSTLLNRLNKKTFKLFSYGDVSRGNEPFSQLLISASSSISYSQKEQRFAAILLKPYYLPRLEVSFNRSKAALMASDPTNPFGKSLLEQMMAQVSFDMLPNLRQSETPWRVKLLGEGATDAGGPGRDLYTQICLEIQQPYMKLFMTPHSTSNGYLVPNTDFITDKRKDMFIYVGALIGGSYVTKLPQPFRFMPLVWSYLVGNKITKEEIYDFDHDFKKLMKTIRSIQSKEEFDTIFKDNLFYTVLNSKGDVVELFSEGSSVPVTFENKDSYCDLCENYRINEFDKPLQYMSKGIQIFIPESLRKMLTPHELEVLICGDLSIPVSELKKHCRFEQNDKHVQMLWEVLERFTSEERMLFIKFATGRMGLPPPGMKWSSPLCIRFDLFIDKSKADDRLPTASTCSSAISIPLYSSVDIMEKRIRAAITFGCDIERDHEIALDELVSIT